MNKVNWCFSIKKGLSIIEPNMNLSQSYLDEAKKTISRVKSLIEEDDFIWASVRIYYSAYYSLYSFLQRIGVKSENHDCSIELAKSLLEEDFISNIDMFKKGRIDSQYYLKIGKKGELSALYNSAKEFYLRFNEIVRNLSEEDIKEFQIKLSRISGT